MALSTSALSELLDALRAGDGVDLIRDAVRLVLREPIELNATGRIGAARYERSETRVTERSGSRPRALSTSAADGRVRQLLPGGEHGQVVMSAVELSEGWGARSYWCRIGKLDRAAAASPAD